MRATLARRLVVSHLALAVAVLLTTLAALGATSWREAVRAGVRADRAMAVRLAPLVRAVYRARGSWEAVGPLLPRESEVPPPAAPGMPRDMPLRPGMPMPWGRRAAPPDLADLLDQPIVIVDGDGRVLLARNIEDADRSEVRRMLREAAQRGLLPDRAVAVSARPPEAYLLVGSMIAAEFNPVRERFATTLGMTGLVLLVVVGGGAFAISLVWSRTLSGPLQSLAAAAAQMAAGDRSVRVAERHGDDEVGELSRTFNAMVTAIESQEAARRRFVADAAHELRTPLSMLQARVELLSSGVYQPGADQWQRITAVLGRLGGLVDDLQLLARIDAGRLEIARAPVHLTTVVRRVTDELEPAARARRVTVETRVEGTAATVEGDAGRLIQAVTNLVANAIRYSPEGGRIRLSVRHDTAATVTLAVEDQGGGIAPEDRERVFERFVRLDTGRDRASGGSGLGLAIARELLAAHGATLAIDESTIGGGPGARVVVTFPSGAV